MVKAGYMETAKLLKDAGDEASAKDRVATALNSVKRFDKLAAYLLLIPDTGNDICAFRGIAQELVKSGNVKRLDLLLSCHPSDAARTHACLGAYDQLRVE